MPGLGLDLKRRAISSSIAEGFICAYTGPVQQIWGARRHLFLALALMAGDPVSAA